MYDPTIHRKSLARLVRKADFAAFPGFADRELLDDAIERAFEIGRTGFGSVTITSNILRGKPVYKVSGFAEDLVIRHISLSIKRITQVKHEDRHYLVSCILKIVSEGLPFRIYKFDIKSFYESINCDAVLGILENDEAFSAQSARALRSFFNIYKKCGADGLPRGMNISATLSEYFMQEFDHKISKRNGIWFYGRFVDDMIIITDGNENPIGFQNLVEGWLPGGLQFNAKSRILKFEPFQSGNSSIEEHSFDFLGYKFHVSYAFQDSDRKRRRDTWLDISDSKVRRIKTRVAVSVLKFNAGLDFSLLHDRIRLLTSNFNYVDKKREIRRISGIYFNYRLVDGVKSAALPELDAFLVNALTAPHSRNRIRPTLTQQQRQQLLNLRFQDGFNKKRFFSFSPYRLAQLTSGWKYA